MDISFVFSNDLRYRITRHLFFWTAMFAYQWMVDFIVPTFFEGATYDAMRTSAFLFVAYLPGQLLLTYGVLYFVIPHVFFRSRYLTSIALVAALCFAAGFANEVSYRLFTEGSVSKLFSSTGMHSLGMHRILGVAGFAACIKFIKYWYDNEYLNSILEKEKLKAELQSLKAQIHPHFLFNTLNNIYSVTENISPQASDMLLRLSALLRYILYECNKPEILLAQEFKMIQDYIALESIRYSKSLDIRFELPDQADHYWIAPLLLLPLIENCFKHGASKLIDQPWINIQVELREGDVLQAKLINGKPHQPEATPSADGIGLANIRKRLELLYPGNHELKILPEPHVFVVVLKLKLHKTPQLTEA